MPALDEGPHRGYAIQWFAFAVIALVGAGAVVVRERRMA
jgi:cytochrome oxidase assembly protein ShyY1